MIKNNIVYNNFSDYQFNFTRAKGSFVFENNHKLIDFSSGWNVANLGWNNDEIKNAIIEQAKKNIYAPMWTEDPIQKQYAANLVKSLPKDLEIITREVSGVTANIMALKTARAYTGKKKIISFRNTFHGSLYQTLQLGYLPHYPVSKSIFLDFKYNIHLDYPKVKRGKENEKSVLEKFSKTLDLTLSKSKDVAALITEPGIISGWGSTYTAPSGFLKEIRKITAKYNVLMIVDEVGTGFSRTGKLFAIEHEKVTPDIVVMAKAMGNGASIAATVTTKKIAEKTYKTTNPQSTFGWTPLNVAAADKTLEIHKRDKIWEKAEKDGDYAKNILKQELENNSFVDNIDGIGLEIGINLIPNKKINMKKLIIHARKKGLHLAFADSYGFQIMPPLNIERNVLEKGLKIIIDTVKSI